MTTEKKNDEQTQVLQKVSHTLSYVTYSKNVDQVILALHSLAILIFPIDASSLSGFIWIIQL